MHNRLAAIVRVERQSECENSGDERHLREPKWLGTIQVWDVHHKEQPNKVMCLGALQLYLEVWSFR